MERLINYYLIMRAHGAPSDPSGAAVPDGDLFPFHYYRYAAFPL